MSNFDEFFTENLTKTIERLVDRDRRLKLFDKSFWIVEKHLEKNFESL